MTEMAEFLKLLAHGRNSKQNDYRKRVNRKQNFKHNKLKLVATEVKSLDIFKIHVHVKVITEMHRAPDTVCTFISILPFSSPKPMFDHLLELSQ